jgi:N utilization substance protein B
MWIGAYEFQHCLDVPWRVVLNECIELAKEFGGTDGHKYVNAVLNKLAPRLRPAEVAPPHRASGNDRPGHEAPMNISHARSASSRST